MLIAAAVLCVVLGYFHRSPVDTFEQAARNMTGSNLISEKYLRATFARVHRHIRVQAHTYDPLARVVAAAASVLGTRYVFGAESPSAGFDCSGLVAWAWSRVGKHLPHSALSMRYDLPRVSLGHLRRGDIIYYDSSDPHVALYVGHGTIIQARHPGSGGQVQYGGLWSYDTPLAAMRP